MIEILMAFFGLVSAGILLAHAVDAYRVRLDMRCQER
jgi:hypothetical protein